MPGLGNGSRGVAFGSGEAEDLSGSGLGRRVKVALQVVAEDNAYECEREKEEEYEEYGCEENRARNAATDRRGTDREECEAAQECAANDC